MKLTRVQWAALLILLGGVLMILLLATAPDTIEADSVVCRSNGGVYLWHKRECIQARM